MKNALLIAKFTFVEVYRSRLMYGLVILALALFLVSYIASEFAYGAPDKIALDFSIGAMSFSSLMISVFLGSTLLSKEIESKTIYMILSRPLSRNSFLIGKIIGLSSVLVFNILFLTSAGTIVFLYLGGKFSNLIFWIALFTLLESILIMCFGVLFSLITNVTMSVMFTILILITGHTFNETMSGFFAKNNPAFKFILKLTSYVLPDLERLNFKDFLIYKHSIELNLLVSNALYALLYIVILMAIQSKIFNSKNLD